MPKNNDMNDLYPILIDPFREAIHALYAGRLQCNDLSEKFADTHKVIVKNLVEEYPPIAFYGAAHPIKNLFKIVANSSYFDEENKNDTVDMLNFHLQRIRGEDRKARSKSAKFIMELFSRAYTPSELS